MNNAPIRYIATTNNSRIAYLYRCPKVNKYPALSLLYINGWYSTFKNSRKAIHLDNWTTRKGLSFMTYDHYAHGMSEGKMHLFTIGKAKQDLLVLINTLLRKSQNAKILIVASSMGLWLALLVAKELPHNISGILGIGGAINFTQKLLEEIPEEQRRSTHSYRRPSQYDQKGFYEAGWQFLLEGSNHHIHAPWEVRCPIKLLHGIEDKDVHWKTALDICDRIRSPDLTVTLIKGADHRLSTDKDLEHISTALDALIQQTREPTN